MTALLKTLLCTCTRPSGTDADLRRDLEDELLNRFNNSLITPLTVSNRFTAFQLHDTPWLDTVTQWSQCLFSFPALFLGL